MKSVFQSGNKVQATLAELTATTVLQSVEKVPFDSKKVELIVCGGGVHNAYLMSRLKVLGKGMEVKSSAEIGVDPDWLEAMAFAWLAKRTMEKKPGNLPSATGARQESILGCVHY